jgi:hypothetical protein
VGEQVRQGHGLGVGCRDLKGVQVAVDIGVQIQQSPLDELHHRGPGDELGDGAGAEQGLLRRHRLVARKIRLSEAPKIDGLVPLHEYHGGARDAVECQLAPQQPVEECTDLARSQYSLVHGRSPR